MDSTRDRIDKRERETGMQQQEIVIHIFNKGDRASTIDHLSVRNEESEDHTSLPSKKFGLEHKFGYVLPSTKPSWKHHATEMAEDSTWLLMKKSSIVGRQYLA